MARQDGIRVSAEQVPISERKVAYVRTGTAIYGVSNFNVARRPPDLAQPDISARRELDGLCLPERVVRRDVGWHVRSWTARHQYVRIASSR